MTTTSDSVPPVTLDDATRSALQRAGRMVVPTDDRDDALARARAAALSLAREFDLEIVLYDRSDERWTDTPHAGGPFPADEIDEERRPHLVRQLRDLEAGGVRATAWLATVPALTAILDVVQEIDVDVVLVPDHLDKPKMMDRIQIGGETASMVDRVVELQLPNPPTILVLDADGSIAIASYAEGD